MMMVMSIMMMMRTMKRKPTMKIQLFANMMKTIVVVILILYASSSSGAAGRRSLGREAERRRGRGEKSKLESAPPGRLRNF